MMNDVFRRGEAMKTRGNRKVAAGRDGDSIRVGVLFVISCIIPIFYFLKDSCVRKIYVPGVLGEDHEESSNYRI